MWKALYPKGLKPGGRTHAGAGKKCVKEEVRERRRYGLIANPIPHLPEPLGREKKDRRTKLSLDNGGRGEVVF